MKSVGRTNKRIVCESFTALTMNLYVLIIPMMTSCNQFAIQLL